jgi:tRNA A37 threonylcarbamoyladenosine modification protein TsaB
MRVGIATMQALALVHDRLVVPVSALEALGQCGARLTRAAASEASGSSGEAPLVGAVMEAYRGEVFGALYRVRGSQPQTESLFDLEEVAPPSVANAAALASQWAAMLAHDAGSNPVAHPSRAPHVIIGDGVSPSEAALRAQWPEARLEGAVPLAGVIARIAAASPARAVRPHAIVPLYVRRTDAELTRDRQQQAATGPR